MLTSNRLIRTNYNPTGQPDFSDIPLIDNEVELIIRSQNEFITHLNLEPMSLPIFDISEFKTKEA